LIYNQQFILDQFAPIAVYEKLKTHFKNQVSFLFESADSSEGNYSIVVIGARERITYKNGTTTYFDENSIKHESSISAFDFLKDYYKKIDTTKYQEATKELKIGYVDGFIGFIGYDMVRVFEPTLKKYMDALIDELDTPDMDLILPKLVLVYSHKDHKITILTTLKEYYLKFDEITDLLKSSYNYTPIKKAILNDDGKFAFDKATFFDMVHKSKEMIRSGDVFQILMANRYTQKCDIDPFSFYRILRSKNPSPYMYLMEYEDFSIVGSSPEVMIRVTNKELLLRPIAGTRKRGSTKEKDRAMEDELISDPKERAEHLMLIDLGRNDVGRVAKVGSVKVEDMMHVEKYSHVMHMVSDITATLADDKDMFDLFAATFTAGTMTGAPKIRAMELIAEFEGIKRGFYSGAIGYFGFDGNMDSAITIRTAMIKDGKIVLQAGAGVVADSQDELEYLEVKNKLGALVSTIEDLANI
jgi:anthranilate synthase component I